MKWKPIFILIIYCVVIVPLILIFTGVINTQYPLNLPSFLFGMIFFSFTIQTITLLQEAWK